MDDGTPLPRPEEEPGDARFDSDEDSWPLSDEETVEDPEALRRAEEAVARMDERPAGGQPGPEGTWVPVASESVPGGMMIVALTEVFDTIEAEGVPVGWDPRDPREDGLSPVANGKSTYRVMVPEDSLAQVRRALYGVPPDGVEYAWPTGPAAATSPPVPTPVTGAGTSLSDNAAFARQAEGGGAGVGIALLLAVALLAIAIAAFLLLRG
jgi:hypothetical protein